MTHYLMVKTHLKTGLQYLCKTTRNPFKYNGSGTYWRRHLKIHGEDVGTQIVLECQNNDELKEWGIYYSTLWNVVESDLWANLKPEMGDGGDMGPIGHKKHSAKMKGHPNWLLSQTDSAKKLIGNAQREFISSLTPGQLNERMKNSCCHPDSYTEKRIENMRNGMIGKKKTKTPKLLKAIEARKERSTQNMLKAADNHRGKTWKLIDGKRVWMNKENKNY